MISIAMLTELTNWIMIYWDLKIDSEANAEDLGKLMSNPNSHDLIVKSIHELLASFLVNKLQKFVIRSRWQLLPDTFSYSHLTTWLLENVKTL